MAKPIGLGVFLAIGIVLLLLGAFFMFKWRQAKKEEIENEGNGAEAISQKDMKDTQISNAKYHGLN